jgi:hypothetical protein
LPGWYADPTGRHESRLWNGNSWTDDVGDGGLGSTDPLLPVDPRSSRRRLASTAAVSAGVMLCVWGLSTWSIIAVNNSARDPVPPEEVTETIVFTVIPQALMGVVLFLVLWAMQQIRRTGWRIFWTTVVSVVGAVVGLIWGLFMTILTGLSGMGDQEVW